jgi:L-lysine 2,3-aminomutase
VQPASLIAKASEPPPGIQSTSSTLLCFAAKCRGVQPRYVFHCKLDPCMPHGHFNHMRQGSRKRRSTAASAVANASDISLSIQSTSSTLLCIAAKCRGVQPRYVFLCKLEPCTPHDRLAHRRSGPIDPKRLLLPPGWSSVAFLS